jgi:hypothetical protein
MNRTLGLAAIRRQPYPNLYDLFVSSVGSNKFPSPYSSTFSPSSADANNLVSDLGMLDSIDNCPRLPRTAAMEYAENNNRQVLEELLLMEACLTEKIAGRCDSAERRVEEWCDSIHATLRRGEIQSRSKWMSSHCAARSASSH